MDEERFLKKYQPGVYALTLAGRQQRDIGVTCCRMGWNFLALATMGPLLAWVGR